MAYQSGICNSGDIDKREHGPETIVIINCVLNAPLMLISVLGNTSGASCHIKKASSLRSPSFILLCSLAVSDLFVGLLDLLQPIYIATYRLKENVSLPLALFIAAFALCGVSLFTMTDSYKCGSVLGASLPHAISKFDNYTAHFVYIGNSLAHHHSFIIFEFFENSRGRKIFCYCF